MIFSLIPTTALAGDPIDNETELKDAITNVAEGGTITIGGNISLSDTLEISGTKSFTINLNNYRIANDNKSGKLPLYFSGSGTLTITDSSTAGGGKIEFNYNEVDCYDTIKSDGNGKIIVKGNASILNDNILAAIYITGGTEDKDVLEVEGSAVIGSTHGSAIDNRGKGNIKIKGGTITGG